MNSYKVNKCSTWKNTTPASRLYQDSWSPYSQEFIKHFDYFFFLWCLHCMHSNLACRYSLQYSCIHTRMTDSHCGGWDIGARDGCVCVMGVHVHLVIGGIKAKLYSHFKALKRHRWSLLIPCQSTVCVHSPLNWGINERHPSDIPITRAFMHNIKSGKHCTYFSHSSPSPHIISSQFYLCDRSGTGTEE